MEKIQFSNTGYHYYKMKKIIKKIKMYFLLRKAKKNNQHDGYIY